MHSSPTFYPTTDLRCCPLHTEIYPCADPSNVSFGSLTETHSPTLPAEKAYSWVSNVRLTPDRHLVQKRKLPTDEIQANIIVVQVLKHFITTMSVNVRLSTRSHCRFKCFFAWQTLACVSRCPPQQVFFLLWLLSWLRRPFSSFRRTDRHPSGKIALSSPLVPIVTCPEPEVAK